SLRLRVGTGFSDNTKATTVSAEGSPMRSKTRLVGVAVLLSLSAASCGQFGQKGDLDDLMRFAGASTGCMNDIGPQFEKYFNGEITGKEWGSTWDCAGDSLKMFKKFVLGSG